MRAKLVPDFDRGAGIQVFPAGADLRSTLVWLSLKVKIFETWRR
jgi:hypothetical protein